MKVLIQYDWCPYKRGNLDTRTQGKCHMKMTFIVRDTPVSQEVAMVTSKPPEGRREAKNSLLHRPKKEPALLTT